MDRRKFLGVAGMGAVHRVSLSRIANALVEGTLSNHVETQAKESKTYGSGHFGEWITDRFGLPAYRYTCDQISDEKAVTLVHKE